MCLPPSTALSENVFENYGDAELVGGSASGLAKFVVVVATF